MTDDVTDLCFSDEEERDLALAVARSSSGDFDHVAQPHKGHTKRRRKSKKKSHDTSSATARSRRKRKLTRNTGVEVIALDESVEDLSHSPVNHGPQSIQGIRNRLPSDSEIEIVGDIEPVRKVSRKHVREGGVISGADFLSDDQITAATSSALRRSEVSNQDYEFERSRLADLAKERQKRRDEKVQHNAELKLVRARSFLEHHAQGCNTRVAKCTAPTELETGEGAGTPKCALKIRFPGGKTHQVTLSGSSPLSVLFDFCDAKLFDHAAAGESAVGEDQPLLDADVASVLAQHTDNAETFSRLPDRYSYALKIIARKPVWIRRPMSQAVSKSQSNPPNKNAQWTISSAGLQGRTVLVLGQPPVLPAHGTTREETNQSYLTSGWNNKFELLSQFKEKNGHCRVPDTHPELGMWAVTQRAAYQAAQDREAGRPLRSRATILPHQVKQLDKLGFDWV